MRCPSCSREMPAAAYHCALCGTRLPRALPPGTTLGQRYQVVRRLSQRGDRLSTELARDLQQPQRAVVLKEMRPDLRTTPESKRAFQEALARVSALAMPGLPRTLGVVPHGGSHYLVLDHMAGHTLREVLSRQGRLTPDIAMRVLKAALTTLGRLHHLRPTPWLHLDLRPEHLLLSGWDQVSLLDGAWLAALGNPFAPTPPSPYAPPELARGATPVTASDVFALGLTMIEAVSGRSPASLYDPLHDRYVWDPVGPVGLDLLLSNMVGAALSRRPTNVEEVLAALGNLQEGGAPAGAMSGSAMSGSSTSSGGTSAAGGGVPQPVRAAGPEAPARAPQPAGGPAASQASKAPAQQAAAPQAAAARPATPSPAAATSPPAAAAPPSPPETPEPAVEPKAPGREKGTPLDAELEQLTAMYAAMYSQ